MRIILALLVACAPLAAANYPAPKEGDFAMHDFAFRDGGRLSELKIHYATFGTLHGDNAVLIMHGTGGTGKQFISDQFAGVLFGPGQLLDAARYFIVVPDGIGHGKSSKPSDGLGDKFPHYDYDDMVAADHRLLTEGLGVKHLRLAMGTSMGGMHTWVWGETYPDFMDALMPLASAPVQIAGRNRFFRRMMIDALKNDPVNGLRTAVYILAIMTSSSLQLQKQAPTRDAADKLFDETIQKRMDSNPSAVDLLYQVESSRNYNPEPNLEKIRAPLIAINSADDVVNPPELGILERTIQRVPHGRYVLLPITDQTRGHGTHTLPAIWQGYLADLLKMSEPPKAIPVDSSQAGR
ncbi:MAG TPA: alpha/beta fold hydrolase [Bryobacteraceae bacterium]|nr:alpha/beta fold hydrolase [Bryobacteraceae bacterium]